MRIARTTIVRALAIFAASATAVCFPFLLRKLFWPDGLTAWADNIFWPATGVNVAALLVCGVRYWPVLLLNALPACLLLGQPVGGSLLGAAANAAEALVAVWALRRFGRFDGVFDRVRPVAILLAASLVAPLANTLTFPAYLVATGVLAAHDYGKALSNWNLANGDAMLLLAPALAALAGARRRLLRPPADWLKIAAWVAGGIACGVFALVHVFDDGSLNYAFLLFPFVIFAALRHGPSGVFATLAALPVLIYGLMIWNARDLPGERMPAILWFLQAFCWALAATGLLVAALLHERREADQRARDGERRSLEASLREEQARLRALRYQVNPHFLFNTLNSLRSTLPLSADTPRGMIDALAAYLRGALEHADGDTASLERELSFIRGYLDIEKTRFGDDLGIDFAVEVDALRAAVPVFLLQPLVENAIRHGLEKTPGLFRLRIAARREGGRLHIEVANSGAWIERAAHDRPGIGLENIRRRLRLLHGDAAVFRRDNPDGWVRFHIEFPFTPCAAS